jgi:type VI secretion system ImpM family protein
VSAAQWGRPFLIGKLPARGDFVNIGSAGAVQSELDVFLTDAIEWVSERRGSAWHDAYENSGIQAFVFGSRGERGGASYCGGVLTPSRDAAGRRFPLCVAFPFAPSPALMGAPETAPLVLEAYWQAGSELLVDLMHDPMVDLAHRLDAVRVVDEPLIEESLGSYAQWTHELPQEELWSLMLPDASPDRVIELLYLVTETVRPCRNVERPKTPLTLRLPLGAAGGAALCFWLDWVRSIARWRATIPNFFWSHDGSAGTAVLCLGVSPKSTLSELWAPTGERDEICDLTRASTGGVSLVPAQFQPAWRALIETPGRSVAALLESARNIEF